MNRTCTKCKKAKSIEKFKSKDGRRGFTNQCLDCRDEAVNFIKKSQIQDRDEIRLESFNLSYCPWETGEIRQVPYGGIL